MTSKKQRAYSRTWRAALWASLVLSCTGAQCQTVMSAWEPLFKGVDHAVGTNTPGAGQFLNLQVVHFLRVDLSDPDVRLFASPPVTNYLAETRESSAYTTTNALRIYRLQAIINANPFYLPGSRNPTSYTMPEGTVLDVNGLLISQGQVVSPQESREDSSAMLFSSNNVPTFVSTNWPARDTTGAFTAVAGPYSILVNGVNVGSNYFGLGGIHSLEPRTAMGISQDRRYLYLLVIDGRQSGYSDGAYDRETAAWLRKAGAWDGINLDGGGSTCMVVQDSTGRPLPLNRDSASKANNRERTVGAHFGLFAKPLPGFFSDINVAPDDTSARVTWTTIEPATTQLGYGLTSSLGMTAETSPGESLSHSVTLAGLKPATEYFFQLSGASQGGNHTSPFYTFVTTNYVSTNLVFDFVYEWKYSTDNLNGAGWAGATYDDSSWSGPGAGLLWADSRGANAGITMPLNTEMPIDPSTGYPFRTYYFRTKFPFTNSVSGAGLIFEHYLDDGAVYYLNGTEIRRARMPAAPTPIYNNTLASGYGCSGDATCSELFYISGPLLATNLVTGDNVLAVEVHNYSAGSPDITFGVAVSAVVPFTRAPELELHVSNSVMTLSWSGSGFVLQQTDSASGPWYDVPGPITTPPYVVTNSSATAFFRLRK